MQTINLFLNVPESTISGVNFSKWLFFAHAKLILDLYFFFLSFKPLKKHNLFLTFRFLLKFENF